MWILGYLGYSTSHGNMLERSLNKRMAHQLILLYNSNSWIFACQPADIITNIGLLQKNCSVFSFISIFQKAQQFFLFHLLMSYLLLLLFHES